jgi:hypothetical protein
MGNSSSGMPKPLFLKQSRFPCPILSRIRNWQRNEAEELNKATTGHVGHVGNVSSKRLSTAAASAAADLSLPIRAIDGHGSDSVADGNGPAVSEGTPRLGCRNDVLPARALNGTRRAGKESEHLQHLLVHRVWASRWRLLTSHV